jgi:hypothetical protein
MARRIAVCVVICTFFQLDLTFFLIPLILPSLSQICCEGEPLKGCVMAAAQPSNPDIESDAPEISEEEQTLPKNPKFTPIPPAHTSDSMDGTHALTSYDDLNEQTIVTKGDLPQSSPPPPPGAVVADVFVPAPPLRAKLDSATD